MGDDFGPGLGPMEFIVDRNESKILILLFLFVCLFVCLFFLLVCLSNSKSLQISYFKALRNLSKKSRHFSYFFNMFNPLKRRPFPLNPRVAQHTAALSTLPPWSCHLPERAHRRTGRRAQQAGSSFVFERKDQHLDIYIFTLFDSFRFAHCLRWFAASPTLRGSHA